MQRWECAECAEMSFDIDALKQHRGMLIQYLLTCQAVTMMELLPTDDSLWCISGRQDSIGNCLRAS